MSAVTRLSFSVLFSFLPAISKRKWLVKENNKEKKKKTKVNRSYFSLEIESAYDHNKFIKQMLIEGTCDEMITLVFSISNAALRN